MNIDQTLELVDRIESRRRARRGFLKASAGAAVAAGGLSLLAACDADEGNGTSFPTPTPTPTASGTPTPVPSPATDADILNFTLNFAYLQAQYYSYATTGAGLDASLLGGSGTAGAATGARQCVFSDATIGRYARELAADTRAHVAFLRGVIGSTVIAQPAIDLGVTATSAFSNLARTAALITTAAATFDVYESDDRFLLGAFVFEDVVVTAYRGIIASLAGATFLDAAAGMQGAKAYHAGMIRQALYRRGIATPSLIDATEALSTARDNFDGAADIDQGVRPANNASNIVPTDGSGITYARAPAQVLNVAYQTRTSVALGGFFPAGVNGFLKTSATI